MAYSTSTPCGPFRYPAEKIIDYAISAAKGKTKPCLKYAGHDDAYASTISIAQHSWLMAALCLGLPSHIDDSKLDISHCIQLSVVYGMMELNEDLCRYNSAEGLLKELKEGQTLASRIVLEVDKIAMSLLARREIRLPPFVLLQSWAEEILRKLPMDQEYNGTAGLSKPVGWSVQYQLQAKDLPCPRDHEKSLAVFARVAAYLLSLSRQGWVDNYIPEPETVPDHSWLMAVLCFILAENETVIIKYAVQACIVHDIAESLVGDITYRDGICREEKFARESHTIDFLQSQLPNHSPLKLSWDRFESGETLTYKIAKDLDRVDLGLQAYIYERRYGKKLEEFFHSASRVKTCPELVKEIKAKRVIEGVGTLDPTKEQKLNEYYGP
ncbi:uncharacterized protein FIESC28_11413 [Fusarium coffeatum]|uniref:5'-deoxynucleotidase n=1 Tax=Fusarium coffeatum TaxID=231269 RepID=A0A366QK00_9HYPO|nr:uncharacterized protein FIESC28_11413 [Fusarium coffeatum]RBR05203.1 hypothetical protein FIESC28_11413 [Fusarium coffeatum]